MLVYSIAQLLGGYLPYLWDLSETASREYLKISKENNLKNEIIITLMFLFITRYSFTYLLIYSLTHLCLCSVLDTIISLPFGLYKTFVIEEKHGFNKQTMSLYIKDLFISFALTCVIGGPVIAVIITIIRKTGELFYWYVWLFMLAVSVFLLTIFPTYIQPLFNKFTPLDEIVEDASKKWVSKPLSQL
jgi:Zn-dependent protease with chaperone function